MHDLGAIMEPSSRYHRFIGMVGSVANLLVMGAIPREKRTGPNGSPCCTPLVDWMIFSPRKIGFWVQYVHLAHGKR